MNFQAFTFIFYLVSVTYIRGQNEETSLLKEPRFVLVVPQIDGSNNLIESVLNKETVCRPTSTGLLGSCTKYTTCLLGSASFSGLCRLGSKSCCIYSRTGTGSLGVPAGYFYSASDPRGDTTITIRRANSYYCQVRIDFRTLKVEGPGTNSLCTTGQVTITGHTDQDFTICGVNDGQHVYLNFNPNENVLLNISTQDETSVWDIQYEQILCSDTARLAPDGCLQYFTRSSGVVESFGFVNVLNNDPPVTYQIGNLDYQVCLSRSAQYCAVTWSVNPNGGIYAFTVSDNITILEPARLGDPLLSQIDPTRCPDYVRIDGGSYFIAAGIEGESDVYCGLGFPETVITETSPFNLHVFTDVNETSSEFSDSGNVGFSLKYNLDTVC